MKNFNKRRASGIFLVMGMAFLVTGLTTDNTIFSQAAVVLVLVSLIMGGRWMRPRKK
jgi:hypothetical protein